MSNAASPATTPLHRLTSLFRDEEQGALARTQDISINYFSSLDCEISIRAGTPQTMVRHLRAAFMGADSLFRRMSHPQRKEPVHVEIPGQLMDYATHKNTEKCLARLSFIDHDGPAKLSFNDDGVVLEGPTLNNFITALTKAGDDWEKVDLRPVQRLLRLVPKPHGPQP